MEYHLIEKPKIVKIAGSNSGRIIGDEKFKNENIIELYSYKMECH
jgi:hypothetical protein